MKRSCQVLATALALSVPATAHAAFDSEYFESGAFLDPVGVEDLPDVIDLGEAKPLSGPAPTIGPNDEDSTFDTVGESIRLRGALNVAEDGFFVEFTTPGLKFIVNDLTFYQNKSNPNTSSNPKADSRNPGGTLELSFDGGGLADQTFEFDDDVGTVAYASMGSPLGFEFENGSGDQLIAYDIEVVATPLPGALVLFGTGLAGIAGYRRWIKPAA